jgi:hypothetical protein
MRYCLTEARRRAVLALLTSFLGRRPTILSEELIGHEWAPVTRLTLDCVVPGSGSSVVVKTRRVDGVGHGGPAHLRREQVGLRLAERSGVTPRIVAANDAIGVMVSSDLGPGPDLESILLGHNARAAADAFVGLGRSVGCLHASTISVKAAHREALLALGLSDPTEERLGEFPGVNRWHDVEAAAAELGFPEAAIARADMAFVWERLVEPARFAAIVHADLNPTNVVLTEEGVKLVDFEGSFFGHMGIDAAFLHYPFPTYSAHWAVIPDEVVLDADRAYRLELASVLPSLDMAHFDEMLAVGAAAALAVRVQRLRLLARPDQTPHDRWRRRAQLIQQIRVFERLATRADCLPALVDWFAQLAHAMAARWPDATNPPPRLFPAFASPHGR